MASINQATVIGFVGDEPKIMQTKNKKAMATFSIATTERGYTRPDGTSVEDITDWHNIVFFGKPAEVIQRFVRKGALLYVQGKMRTRSYVDKDNITRYVTEIIGDNFQLLDKPSSTSTQQASQSAVNAYPTPDDNMPPF